jgi:hypothetical protein
MRDRLALIYVRVSANLGIIARLEGSCILSYIQLPHGKSNPLRMRLALLHPLKYLQSVVPSCMPNCGILYCDSWITEFLKRSILEVEI